MTNPNCLFCQQPLEFWETFEPNNGPSFYDAACIYQCQPCNSQQDFHRETNELTYYNFRMGPYWLSFHLRYNFFRLGKDPPDEPGNTESILTLDFLPNLTPQNTTEERIKLILLFS